MNEFYLTKRNLIISRQSSVQKAYDISRKDRTFKLKKKQQ